ncbi:MAG: solute:sodium symporter family transporter [Phycisphaerae bacterium]
MAVLDWIVIVLYFGVLLAVAWWSIRQRQNSASDYFLAGRHVGWFVVGASLFASNIGSEHLVGLAGAGASSGVTMGHYELHAWCLLVLGWVMVPFYLRSAVFTMPEFLERRYTPAARWFLSVVSLIAYVFTKIAVGLAAGGIVFKALFPENLIEGLDNFWLGAVGVVIATGVYVVLGGLRAVVYTETVQTLVFLFGSAVILIVGLDRVGGWGRLYEICGSEYFNLWKPLTHPEHPWWSNPHYPWLGMLVGAPIVGLWYWCTDQYIVQRTLAAYDERNARRGTICAAYMKLLPLFIFIVPGMIAFALAKTGQLGDSSGTVLTDSNQSYPILVKSILPVGIRGLVVAGLLAALMSSLAAVFNSSSTLFTMDIYQKIRPHSSDAHLVWVGRLATGIMVLFGLAWIPVMAHMSSRLYDYLQIVQAYIAPPIFAVFFLGVFFPRINGAGCMVGLVGGFLIGMTRLTLQVLVDRGSFVPEPGTFPHYFVNLYWQYFCIALALFISLVIVAVSLVTAPPAKEKLEGLTYATVTGTEREKTRASWNRWDVIHTCAVLALIGAAYLYFNG